MGYLMIITCRAKEMKLSSRLKNSHHHCKFKTSSRIVMSGFHRKIIWIDFVTVRCMTTMLISWYEIQLNCCMCMFKSVKRSFQSFVFKLLLSYPICKKIKNSATTAISIFCCYFYITQNVYKIKYEWNRYFPLVSVFSLGIIVHRKLTYSVFFLFFGCFKFWCTLTSIFVI